MEDKPLTEEELSINHIKILAQTQSKIHKLNIVSNLPCSYRKIKIEFDKYLLLTKKIDSDLYKTILNNIQVLNEIVTKCNNKIKIMKTNLCLSHNDYKLLNVLWNNETMTLIDFDATGLANPSCCLCESAFTFSKFKNTIKYNYYEEYLRTYLTHYGPIKEDFNDCLYASFNGKLQWLEYMLSKSTNKKNNYINESIKMINELVLYYNNINQFYNIYIRVLKSL